MRADVLVEAYQELREADAWVAIEPHATVSHLFGDCNIHSDLISRAKWDDLYALCHRLGIKPVGWTPRLRRATCTTTSSQSSRPPTHPSTLRSLGSEAQCHARSTETGLSPSFSRPPTHSSTLRSPG